ncbi:DUF5980 family protein [Glycomyces sp. A-F 0318]|uniref:DUF5980 family protein n=1 Tax=Glycomyces amatae TaxID=2881355 RepID=UPI001E488F32|nr:DUF5980 family protein [Glycomyces amatae]MCD0445751.1 DUF5980 family protein [Glycomyces amatae]
MLAVAIGMGMSLAFSPSLASASAPATTQAEAPATEATWELADGVQRLCIPANRPYWSYFVGFLSGHWDTTLTAEVQGFPEGTEVEMTTSVPPGDNGDRSIGTIWIGVDLPPLDYGDYPATLYVTDGTSTQTMDILVRAQDKWGCPYPPA